MANDTFATFLPITGLGSSDFLVGYQNISETRISYPNLVSTLNIPNLSEVSSNSASWNSTYTTLNNNSGKYESAYTTVNTTSSLISLSATEAENILVLGNSINILSAVSTNLITVSSPVSAFVVQINGVNYRFLAYQ